MSADHKNPLYYTDRSLDRDTSLRETHDKVTGASRTPRGKDAIGAVSNGWVEILAPLLEDSSLRLRNHETYEMDYLLVFFDISTSLKAG